MHSFASVLIHVYKVFYCKKCQSYILSFYVKNLCKRQGTIGRGSSVGCASAWYADGRGFDPHVRQHSFLEFGQEIISTTILSLPLIQEGQLSVTGERLCSKCWVNCRGGLPRNSMDRLTDRAREMTWKVSKGRKIPTQQQQLFRHKVFSKVTLDLATGYIFSTLKTRS